MKFRCFLILSFLVQAAVIPMANAKRAPASEKLEGIHLMQMDDDFPIEEFEKENRVSTHRLSERDPDGLPPLREQKRMLREAGLEAVIDWDPVERDIFFGITGQSELSYTTQKYAGRAPALKIRRLRKIIDTYRAEIRERR